MATKYFALLTNIGIAKLAKATALGTKIEITQMAVGDGNGVLPTPDPAQTALVHEWRRAPLNMLTVDPENASQVIAEQVIPEDIGGWWIREIGLFDSDGDMVAVANCAETYKPKLQEGSGRVQVVRVILIVSSTEAVTLKIDPTVVLATLQYVENKIIEVKSYADGLIHNHEQSRNHPDATTTEKGFTQLSSSVTDDGEKQAATTKAVKIAMDNANARLAKDRNGGDIPNVALFLQNLGLVETINRAAGSLQKDQNGADIPNKDGFVRNIGAARAFSGSVSIGGGGNWTTAEFIAWLELQGAFNHPYWMCKGSWSYGDNRTITDSGCGNIQLAGAVVVVMGVRGAMTIRVTKPTAATSGVTNAQFTYINHGGGYPAIWRRDFNTANKPTPTDVGALPITGGNLQGTISFLFSSLRNQANCLIGHGDANGILACGYGYYQDRFDIHFYDEKGAWVSNPFTVGRNGNVTITGNLGGGAVFDAGQRVYSPNNPPPATDLSAYATRQWVLQNTVQDIDHTAPTEFQFWDGRGYMRPTDGAAMYNFQMVGGSSNVGYIQIRYTRKLVNGTWYVIN